MDSDLNHATGCGSDASSHGRRRREAVLRVCYYILNDRKEAEAKVPDTRSQVVHEGVEFCSKQE